MRAGFHSLITPIFTFAISLLLNNNIIAQTLDQRADSLISLMTLEEKILQLHQEGSFNTADNSRLEISGFIMADGPHGVRDGMATSFPVGIAMAATWDRELIYRVGFAMGKEFKGKGKNQALGPCMDLCRDPRNGRSPESGGEDPFLVSQITTQLIKGIQDAGVIATAKHFNGVNKQENRYTNNVIISERYLMEHYGLNFRNAVQEGGVLSVMNAYNLINNQKCAENHHLLTVILRTYWGFPFYVVSDWNSIWNSKNAIEAGCNVCMGSDHYQNDLYNLVQSGAVSMNVIDDAVKRVLRTKILAGLTDYYPSGNPDDVNSSEHQMLALESARKSIVLLKNQDNILPLNPNIINKIAVIGPSANIAQLDGAGSSYVTPFYSVSPRQGISNKIGANKVSYAIGCDINSTNTSGFQDALNAAAVSDYVIFVGGLDASQEGEGFDRVGGSTKLPGRQLELINLLSTVNQNIIVVLKSGGICSINSAIGNIKSLIYAFYPGQEGGNAIADVLFGDYNPGGKLPVTMPKSDAQLPDWNHNFNDDFGCGYRWYDKQNLIPEFPFGFGLSYTTFEYSNLRLSSTSVSAGEEVNVLVDIKNTGAFEGEEVVQLYISKPYSMVDRSVKELKNFRKIFLLPDETKTVSFTLNAESFYYFDDSFFSYQVEGGEYQILVGGSSDNLPLSAVLGLNSSSPRCELRVTGIKHFPAYPLEGEKVVFLAMIKNEGTEPSPDGLVHEVKFLINGQAVTGSINFNESIPIGAVRMICADIGSATGNWWIAEEPGEFILEAVIDPDNVIQEWNENNNSRQIILKVYSSPPENIAKNKNVVVSSIEGPGLEGPKAVDGNRGTRWSSEFSDPQFIYVDLEATRYFNRIDLIWEYAYGREYTIDVSNDEINWTTLKHVYNSDGGLDRIDLSANARFVRMYGLQRGTQWGYSLYEFEVYDTLLSSGIEDEEFSKVDYIMEQNYPNPFNPSTIIGYQMPEDGRVLLKVYDILGREVAVLLDESKSKGYHEERFDASGLSTGIYFYQLISGNFQSTRKMVYLK